MSPLDVSYEFLAEVYLEQVGWLQLVKSHSVPMAASLYK